MKPTCHAFLILLAGLALGTAANLLAPHRIAWVQDWSNHVENLAAAAGLRIVDLTEVRAMLADGATLVLDARAPESYGAGHLPGALSLPADSFDALYAQYAPLFEPGTPLLVYCSGVECDESLLLGQRLQEQGHTNVSIFPGGYSAWMNAAANGAAP